MKRVFLTGASSGIGPGIVLALFAEGDEVDIALTEAARQVKYGEPRKKRRYTSSFF